MLFGALLVHGRRLAIVPGWAWLDRVGARALFRHVVDVIGTVGVTERVVANHLRDGVPKGEDAGEGEVKGEDEGGARCVALI